jgi:hypothetical protein
VDRRKLANAELRVPAEADKRGDKLVRVDIAELLEVGFVGFAEFVV